MIFRRSYSDPFRRDVPAACFGPAMMAPMMAASLALGAAGTAMSVIGQSNQAAAQARQANYMAQVARNNQTIAQRNATLATQEGEAAAQQQELRTRSITGSQKAALAAQGGDITTGSNKNIIGDTAMAGQADVDAIKYNAALKAYGYNLQAAGAGASASNYSAAATNATANLPFTIGSTLLGGASSAAGKWYDYMRANPGGGGGGGNINPMDGSYVSTT
jgi:TolA-binding protein